MSEDKTYMVAGAEHTVTGGGKMADAFLPACRIDTIRAGKRTHVRVWHQPTGEVADGETDGSVIRLRDKLVAELRDRLEGDA